MRNHRKTASIAALIAGSVAAGIASHASAQSTISSLTSNDFVVLRGGDSSTPDTTLTATQVPIYLDEYTPAGVLVGSIAVPNTGSSALTLPGTGDNQHDGVLSLTGNGQYLAFAGYQRNEGGADAFAGNASGGYAQPVIGVIGSAATSLTTNTIVQSYGAFAGYNSSNPYIRGAYSLDGTSGFYTFGKYPASNATADGGLSYVTGTGPTATTSYIEPFADWRDITVANGQLYGGTGSSSSSVSGNHGVFQIGTGTPTAATAKTSNIELGSENDSASALQLLDIPTTDAAAHSYNGEDVVYTIGDQNSPSISKYYYNGTSWVNSTVDLPLVNGIINPTGLIAIPDPGAPSSVDIVVTGTNGFETFVDTSGDPAAAIVTDDTNYVPAPVNEQFFGAAPAPGSTAVQVPEPASLTLLGLGAVSLLARRRHTRNSSL
jgi:hypothetical protein